MVRSMYSGVSGLKSHQTRMDVIGNNIANVNTFGFKAGRVTFRDVYYQTLASATGPTSGAKASGGVNANQVGYGTSVGSIDTMHTRSGFQFTDQGFDVAIAGEGYFQVQDPDGNRFFTRAGILNIDPAGNVVDANGYFVLGADANIMTATVPPSNATVGTTVGGILVLGTVGQAGGRPAAPATGTVNYGGADMNITTAPPCAAANAVSVNFAYAAGAGDPTAAWNNGVLTITIGDTAIPQADFAAKMQAAIAGATGTPPTVPGTNPAQNISVELTMPNAGQTLQATAGALVTGGTVAGGADAVTMPPVGKFTNDITMSYTYDANAAAAVTGTWTGKSLSVVIGPDAFQDVPLGYRTVGSGLPAGELSPAEMQNMMNDAMNAANQGTGANAPPVVPGSNPPVVLDVTISLPTAVPTDSLKLSSLTDGAAIKGITKGGKDISTAVTSDTYAEAGNPASGSKPADIKPINILTLINQALKGKPGVTGDILKNEFTGVGIAKDGTIMGKHPKYGDVVLGRIDVSTFANPNGLVQEGNNYFSASANSGQPVATIPGKDGSGDLVSGALEMSNVDLSGQFTDMIVTQRGFQANSRVITTTDEMLAELINLKR